MLSLDDRFFLRILENGNFDLVKYYFKENSNNIHRPMLYAIAADNLQFAKWLMKKYPQTNLSKYNDLCFRFATKCNSTKMIDWLSTKNANLEANNCEAFHNILRNYQDWVANINVFNIFFNNRQFMEKHFVMLLDKSLSISQKFFPLNRILFIQYLRKLEETMPELFEQYFTKELLENIVKKYKMIFYKFPSFEEYLYTIRANNVIRKDIVWLEDKVKLFDLPVEIENGIIRKVVVLDKEKVETQCFICSSAEIQLQTNCKHNFCKNCVYKWLERSSKCPFCRTEITDLLCIRL